MTSNLLQPPTAPQVLTLKRRCSLAAQVFAYFSAPCSAMPSESDADSFEVRRIFRHRDRAVHQVVLSCGRVLCDGRCRTMRRSANNTMSMCCRVTRSGRLLRDDAVVECV